MNSLVLFFALVTINCMVYVNAAYYDLQHCLNGCNGLPESRKQVCINDCNSRYNDDLQFDEHSNPIFRGSPRVNEPPQYYGSGHLRSFLPEGHKPFDRKKQKKEFKEWQRQEAKRKAEEKKEEKRRQREQRG